MKWQSPNIIILLEEDACPLPVLDVPELLPDLVLGRLADGARHQQPHVRLRHVLRPLVARLAW